MALSPCIDPAPAERQQLLRVARDAIAWGLAHGRPPEVDSAGAAGLLLQPLGSFVTLTRFGSLRGCIGSLDSPDPLVTGVASAAYGAAFQDPRFSRLLDDEFGQIRIEVSILSPLEPMEVDSREDLLAQLRPGTDGLLLEAGRYRSTFLPKVWGSLPRREDFLSHLLAKAGLLPDFWSTHMRAWRYLSYSFSEPAPA